MNLPSFLLCLILINNVDHHGQNLNVQLITIENMLSKLEYPFMASFMILTKTFILFCPVNNQRVKIQYE